MEAGRHLNANATDEIINLLGSDADKPNSVSKVTTLLMDSGIEYEKIKRSLKGRTTNSLLICLTGLPGAGKSSILNCLLRHRDLLSLKVAVLAFDPSSKKGGALLGDRIRLTSERPEDSLFFRSVGHRGSLTTLPSNLDAITAALFHFGYEIVFVETVGLGQTQDNLPEIFDLIINVQTLTNGDEIQFAKSGLIETGDVIFFNKIENGQNLNLVNVFKQQQMASSSFDSKPAKVLSGSALQNQGIDDLVSEILALRNRVN